MSQYNFIASDVQLKPYYYGIRNEGHRLLIEDRYYIQISEIELFDDLAPYTKAPFIMGLDLGHKFLDKPEKLLNYIETAFNTLSSLEIGSIWLGEDFVPEKRSCHIDELNKELLQWVFSYGSYKNPRSLKVYKYSRGKK